jgi:hypothetical protein
MTLYLYRIVLVIYDGKWDKHGENVLQGLQSSWSSERCRLTLKPLLVISILERDAPHFMLNSTNRAFIHCIQLLIQVPNAAQ